MQPNTTFSEHPRRSLGKIDDSPSSWVHRTAGNRRIFWLFLGYGNYPFPSLAPSRRSPGKVRRDFPLICLASNEIYQFVLYQDGRLIKFNGFQYIETKIGLAEMDNFLSNNGVTVFSSLSGDGDQYIENAPPSSLEDTWGGSVTVNETTITVALGQSDNLVEPVAMTLKIIENYRLANLQPYAPESVSFWVFLEESISLGLSNPTPEPPVLN